MNNDYDYFIAKAAREFVKDFESIDKDFKDKIQIKFTKLKSIIEAEKKGINPQELE